MFDLTDELKNDFELAKKARENAYDPYSNYLVGAVLVTKSGKRYLGCNIMNHGIQGNCAERVAFLKAISEGEREFERIVIVCGPKNGELEDGYPCGYCRQFMSEFVDNDFKIYTLNDVHTMEELLPFGFKL